MIVRFWGTRGSLATPGQATLRYGGNTSCVEVRSNGGTLVVLDCGTGGYGLGNAIAGEPGVARGFILISHTHWDHIQGLPFFAPLFHRGGEWDIYGPKGLQQSLRQTLAGQMEHTYFPVSLESMGAIIRFHDLVEGSFNIGDIKVAARYLNHPALTLGYRLFADGASVVYSCDHEPHSPAAVDGEHELGGSDGRHVDFLSGADLVIHDAQYVRGDFPAKSGWGHSSAEYVVQACCQASVRRVALTHHDPQRDDAAVDRILEQMRRRSAKIRPELEVLAAAEGMALRIEGTAVDGAAAANRFFSAKRPLDQASMQLQMLFRMADGPDRDLLLQAAIEEGLSSPVSLLEGEPLPPQINAERFSLVVLEHDPPAIDGLAAARAIRHAEGDGRVRVPIAIVTRCRDEQVLDSDAATDWLAAPFSLSYARTKIRSWLLRVACRWERAREPADEAARLESLRGLGVLDTPPEDRFDRITRLAAAALDVPIALVSLVDEDRQWFKSCVGLEVRQTPREMAFCAHAVERGEDVIVPDAFLDTRFADNPLVTGEPRVRFYAGSPLMLPDGRCLGTLCVLDTRPRQPSERQLAALHDLRDLAMAELMKGRESR